MKRTSITGMTKHQFMAYLKWYWISFKKHIRIGDWFEALFHTISLGYAKRLATAIASILGYQSCGCCERKQWLNRLTNPQWDGKCNDIDISGWWPNYD